MPDERHDPSYGPRLVRGFAIVIVACCMAGTIFTAIQGWPPAWNRTTQIFIAVYAIAGFVAMVLFLRYLYHPRCPQCRRRMSRTEPDTNTRQELRFRCSHCDVVWTTGVFRGSD